MDLQRTGEAAELAAWSDILAAAPPPIREGLGLEVRRIGGSTCLVASRLDAPEFNRAFGFGLAAPATQAEVAEIAALYAPMQHQYARLQVAPFAEPRGEIDGWLAGSGLTRAALDWAKMARPAAGAPTIATTYRIAEAGEAERAGFASAVCAGFGMPPPMEMWLGALVGRPNWRCYVAVDGAEVVAGAALYLGEDWGWLGVAATRPDRRGRGGQGALMARRIADAHAAGKSHVFTETGAPQPGQPSPSYNNMLRCGFAETHRRANFIFPAA